MTGEIEQQLARRGLIRTDGGRAYCTETASRLFVEGPLSEALHKAVKLEKRFKKNPAVSANPDSPPENLQPQ